MASKEEKRLTFEEHDQLGRERYADFLIELAQNAESEEGSYTIAVNAEYGKGKTTLLRMLASKIREEYTSMDKPLIVVEYNAWKYDYFDEPLMPLAMSLFKNEALADENGFERAAGRFIRITRFVASLSNGVLDHFSGIDLDSALEKSKITNSTEDKFFQYEQAIDNLCDALSKAVDEYGKNGKMIVIIDELDRCKPDFAIKTIEITKHLLTNKKIVFLYALDMGQLQKTVEKAYGTGMDSAGYLLRLFDYITTIPKPCINEYIQDKIRDIEDEQFVEAVCREFENCFSYFHLTLRDIERIVSTYKLMYNNFVKNYKNSLAHVFYIHLLCLRYKKREWFECLTDETREIPSDFTDLYQSIDRRYGRMSKRILEFSRARKIEMIVDDKGILKIIGDVNYDYLAKSTKVKNIDVLYFKDRIGVVPNPEAQFGRMTERLQDNMIIGHVLFPEDLENFKSIRARSIPEYIHQHMEFFDFETGLQKESDGSEDIAVESAQENEENK